MGDAIRTEKVYARCLPGDLERLDAAAAARGLDRSTALRVAMLAWADDVLAGRR